MPDSRMPVSATRLGKRRIAVKFTRSVAPGVTAALSAWASSHKPEPAAMVSSSSVSFRSASGSLVEAAIAAINGRALASVRQQRFGMCRDEGIERLLHDAPRQRRRRAARPGDIDSVEKILGGFVAGDGDQITLLRSFGSAAPWPCCDARCG